MKKGTIVRVTCNKCNHFDIGQLVSFNRTNGLRQGMFIGDVRGGQVEQWLDKDEFELTKKQ